jgi:hypothetical protein
MRYSSTGRIQRKITYTEFKAHDGNKTCEVKIYHRIKHGSRRAYKMYTLPNVLQPITMEAGMIYNHQVLSDRITLTKEHREANSWSLCIRSRDLGQTVRLTQETWNSETCNQVRSTKESYPNPLILKV